MQKIKKLLSYVLFPPLVVISFLVPLSAILLIYIFISKLENSLPAYIVYAVSAYTLTVVSCRTPDIFRFFKKVLNSNQYSRRYLNEADLRAKISLYSVLFLNMIYSVFKLAAGIIYRSVWFGAEAVYYIVLSIMRFSLIDNNRNLSKDISYKWRRYKLCGWMMLLLNAAMTGIAIQIILQNRGYSYHELMIYASASYTFFRLAIAIIHVVKFNKNHDPVLAASKWINLSAALMSLFTLQTAMLSQFGGGEIFSQGINAFTGGAVCIAAICIAIYMINKSRNH